jgi:heme-degrading monooxygenase HmoA
MAVIKKATAHPSRSRTAAFEIEPAGSALLIARIWRGTTLAGKAEEYTHYLCEAGVRKMAAIPGNRGIQMVRCVGAELAEFQILSYWDSLDAVRRFAGEDYEKVRHLPRDPEYMVGPKPTVRHFELLVNHWPEK